MNQKIFQKDQQFEIILGNCKIKKYIMEKVLEKMIKNKKINVFGLKSQGNTNNLANKF